VSGDNDVWSVKIDCEYPVGCSSDLDNGGGGDADCSNDLGKDGGDVECGSEFGNGSIGGNNGVVGCGNDIGNGGGDDDVGCDVGNDDGVVKCSPTTSGAVVTPVSILSGKNKVKCKKVVSFAEQFVSLSSTSLPVDDQIDTSAPLVTDELLSYFFLSDKPTNVVMSVSVAFSANTSRTFTVSTPSLSTTSTCAGLKPSSLTISPITSSVATASLHNASNLPTCSVPVLPSLLIDLPCYSNATFLSHTKSLPAASSVSTHFSSTTNLPPVNSTIFADSNTSIVTEVRNSLESIATIKQEFVNDTKRRDDKTISPSCADNSRLVKQTGFMTAILYEKRTLLLATILIVLICMIALLAVSHWL
jgi:hypothetical protein